MPYTIKVVADTAGISVRTLHHYDAIGLLKPAELSASGYRLYSRGDLDRLQQILFFRELGFALGEIKEIIDRPGFDRRGALQRHRELLVERRARLSELINSLDRTLDAMERGVPMNEKEMFGGFDQSKYEEEARQRWGSTDAYKESMRRTQRYTNEDWAQIKAESDAFERGLAERMDRSPTDQEVQALVGHHHKHICERFYDCPLEMYRGMGEMYVTDTRFTAYWDKIRPGLAQFVKAAIDAYCDNNARK